MTQKTVLVTGASSGIGRATVTRLAEQGYFVFAAARRMDRLDALRSDRVVPVQMDVVSEDSVQSAMQSVFQRRPVLDALVNAAGYAQYGTVEETNLTDAAYQLQVNVLGLARVIQAVLPAMRRQRFGTIVNVSSVAGKVSTPFAGWYGASKHAVEALSDSLRAEVKPLGIRVVLIEPGSIQTEFGDIALGELAKSTHLSEYKPMAASFDKLIRSAYKHAPGPEIIARTIVRALETPNPHPRYALPNDSRMLVLLRRLLSDQLFDRLLSSQIRG